MDVVLIVLAFIAVVVATILIIAALKPDTSSMQRSTSIAAAPGAIFPLINDLHAHRSWSPFDQDPATQRTYSGPAKGVGSALEFRRSQMRPAASKSPMRRSRPGRFRLRMSKPFAATTSSASRSRRAAADRRDLDDERPATVLGEAHGYGHRLRQDVRQPVREGSRHTEDTSRKNKAAPEKLRERKQQARARTRWPSPSS